MLEKLQKLLIILIKVLLFFLVLLYLSGFLYDYLKIGEEEKLRSEGKLKDVLGKKGWECGGKFNLKCGKELSCKLKNACVNIEGEYFNSVENDLGICLESFEYKLCGMEYTTREKIIEKNNK